MFLFKNNYIEINIKFDVVLVVVIKINLFNQHKNSFLINVS